MSQVSLRELIGQLESPFPQEKETIGFATFWKGYWVGPKVESLTSTLHCWLPR